MCPGVALERKMICPCAATAPAHVKINVITKFPGNCFIALSRKTNSLCLREAYASGYRLELSGWEALN